MKKQLRNEPDIAGLIIKVQEQLTLLENKVDILVNRFSPKPAEIKPFPKPFQQPVNTVGDKSFRDIKTVMPVPAYARINSGGIPAYRQAGKFLCRRGFPPKDCGNDAVMANLDSNVIE